MGFTLIECLVTLFCVALLATLALAGNTNWLTQQQSSVSVDKLVHDLKFAREQAILRHSIVTVCPSIDQKVCSSASAWPLGYLIFVDPTGKAIFSQNDEKLVSTTFMGSGNLSNTRNYIQFDVNGFTRSSNSTFMYALNETHKKVIINLQGRIRVE